MGVDGRCWVLMDVVADVVGLVAVGRTGWEFLPAPEGVRGKALRPTATVVEVDNADVVGHVAVGLTGWEGLPPTLESAWGEGLRPKKEWIVLWWGG